VQKEFNLNAEETKVLETLQDDDIERFKSGTVHPLVKMGAHPLGMWMSVILMHSEVRKLRAAAAAKQAGKGPSATA